MTGKHFVFVLIVSALFYTNAEYKSYKDYKVYKVLPRDENDINVLTGLREQGYMFWTDMITANSSVRIMVAPDQQEEFKTVIETTGISKEVVIEDVQTLIDAQLKRPKLNRINSDYSWDYYQSIEEIHNWLDTVAEKYPDIVTTVSMGNTLEGRPLKGLKIDFKKQENPIIGMIEGGIHAREWISPATATWIIKEFLTSEDPDVRFMAENIVWHIFPVVNPDGYSYTFTTNRMWRKNRNPTNFVPCAQGDDRSNGIDLNRNFGFLWNTVGASSNPCDETFAGPIQNSELETRSIILYVEALKREGNLIFYYAFHSYSQMVLVPYSHLSGANVLEAPNYADMYEIAVKGMDKLKEKHGTDYIVGTSADILYEVSGSSFDWAKGEADVPIVYLMELRDLGENGFMLPPEQIVDNGEEVMAGLVEMDRVARKLGYYSVTSNAYGLQINFLLMIALAIFSMGVLELRSVFENSLMGGQLWENILIWK